MARAALRDELHSVHAQLTAQVLAETEPVESAAARVAEWESQEDVAVMRAVGTLGEICTDDHADLARLSVGCAWSVAARHSWSLGRRPSGGLGGGALTTEIDRRLLQPASRRTVLGRSSAGTIGLRRSSSGRNLSGSC